MVQPLALSKSNIGSFDILLTLFLLILIPIFIIILFSQRMIISLQRIKLILDGLPPIFSEVDDKAIEK